MNISIGTDIVSIKRIENTFNMYGSKFVDRILTKNEFNKFSTLTLQRKILYLSKRFAAKESFAKAYGTGIGKDISFKDIEILNDDFGAPNITIIKDKIKKSIKYTSISISDEYPFAISFCLISR